MEDFDFYLVGGAVRDSLLGLRCKDYDYAVEAPSFEAMEAWIVANGGTIFLSKPEFFTSRAKVPGHVEAADYVLCRKEGDYHDGRRPDKVEIGTIYDDLARRDFTVNAMAINQKTKELIDPHGGRRDLEDRLLACVGNTFVRFGEDYLRMLRAMRFHITKGFQLSHEIQLALRDSATTFNLTFLAQHRIYEELSKCFAHDTAATLDFLSRYATLSDRIFKRCGIQLEVKGPAGRTKP